jgi:hypothetical protein
MNVSRLALLVGILVMTAGPPAAVAAPPVADEQLVLVPSGQLQRLYLAPGADLSRVTGVILDPVQVSFRDNWVRDFNNRNRGSRLTQQRADQIRNDVSSGMDTLFADAFRRGGFRILQAPGPDMVRIQTHVVNLSITAPSVPTARRSRIWAATAGEATLVMEVRDPRSNALLARALDRRIARGTSQMMRTSVSNRADFRRVFELWANTSVEDFRTLKTAGRSGASAH